MRLCCECWPTNESKYIPYGGDKDDKDVAPNQQNHSDNDVADPAEPFSTYQLIHRGTDLIQQKEKTSIFWFLVQSLVKATHVLNNIL